MFGYIDRSTRNRITRWRKPCPLHCNCAMPGFSVQTASNDRIVGWMVVLSSWRRWSFTDIWRFNSPTTSDGRRSSTDIWRFNNPTTSEGRRSSTAIWRFNRPTRSDCIIDWIFPSLHLPQRPIPQHGGMVGPYSLPNGWPKCSPLIRPDLCRVSPHCQTPERSDSINQPPVFWEFATSH